MKIELDERTLAFVMNVLAQRPYAEVAPLLANLEEQRAALTKEKEVGTE